MHYLPRACQMDGAYHATSQSTAQREVRTSCRPSPAAITSTAPSTQTQWHDLIASRTYEGTWNPAPSGTAHLEVDVSPIGDICVRCVRIRAERRRAVHGHALHVRLHGDSYRVRAHIESRNTCIVKHEVQPFSLSYVMGHGIR